jgi:hypothetical protein
VRIIIRTVSKAGRVVRREWWILTPEGYPIDGGVGSTRRHCFCLARAKSDQLAAEFPSLASNPLT